MNSADLFAFGIAGSQTESSIGNYAQSVGSAATIPDGVTGWLRERVIGMQQNFTSFVNSRLWEYSARLLGEGQGEFVGRFDVGYLGSAEGQQSAEGLMRDYIMANPNVMKLYQDEIFEGYGGEFSKLCTGIGRDNFFYRQATSGVLMRDIVDEKAQWGRTSYNDSVGQALTFRERVNIHKTWNASNAHIAGNYLDITSPLGSYRKDYVVEDKEM